MVYGLRYSRGRDERHLAVFGVHYCGTVSRECWHRDMDKLLRMHGSDARRMEVCWLVRVWCARVHSFCSSHALLPRAVDLLHGTHFRTLCA